jgi:hypothetical protein
MEVILDLPKRRDHMGNFSMQFEMAMSWHVMLTLAVQQ